MAGVGMGYPTRQAGQPGGWAVVHRWWWRRGGGLGPGRRQGRQVGQATRAASIRERLCWGRAGGRRRPADRGPRAAAGGDHKKECPVPCSDPDAAALPLRHSPGACVWTCSRARVLLPCPWAWLVGPWVRGNGSPTAGRSKEGRQGGGRKATGSDVGASG